jgi:putative protease
VRLEWDLSIGDGVEIWTGDSDSPGGTVTSLNTGRQTVRTAKKGELAAFGEFKGRIVPGSGVYKTLDITLNKAARETFSGKIIKRAAVKGKACLAVGQPLILSVGDAEGHIVTARGTLLPEEAINRPLLGERLKEQLGRTGSTPFYFSELEVDIANGLTIPISEINEVRRQALDELYKIKADRYPDRRNRGSGDRQGREGTDIWDWDGVDRRGGDLSVDRINEVADRTCPASPQSSRARETISTGGNAGLSVYFYKWDERYDYASLGADRIYLPFVSMMRPGFRDSVKALKTAGTEVFAWLPSVTRGNYEKLIERFTVKKPEEGLIGENTPADCRADASESTPANIVDGLLCGNAGTLRKLNGCGLRLAGDIPLNIFNTNSFLEAAGFGLESAALSAELTLQQAACIGKAVKAGSGSSVVPEAAVYGRLPLMISEYCPVGSIAGGFSAGSKCSAACTGGDYSMRDRKGSEFPVLCDRSDCRSTILNSDILFVPEVVKALADAGIGLLRMYIWDEGPEQVRELVKLYKAALFDNNVRTSGFKAAMPNEGRYTKGHYFRGV